MNPPSVLDFTKFVAYSIIFGYMWRLGTAKLADKPLGKAMAAIN